MGGETQTAGESAQAERSDVSHAVGLEVRFDDFAARFLRQARQNRGVAHRLKSSQAGAAAEDGRLAFEGPIDDG